MLQAGVNDLGGTLMDENISRAAGADHGQMMEPADFRALVEPLGRTLEQRTTLYGRSRPRLSASDRCPPDGAGTAPATSDLDEHIAALIDGAGIDGDDDLVFEMVVSALRMGRESVDRGDLKLVNSALKELRYSFLVFEPYRNVPQGVDLRLGPHPGGRRRATRWPATSGAPWSTTTGWSSPAPGPGSWRRASRAPGADRAFGVNIVLPFEQEATPLLAGDPKLINYRYFFTRKLIFMKESSRVRAAPRRLRHHGRGASSC